MAKDDESHLVSGQCEMFGDLHFFTAVLARRDQLDKFLETPDGGATTIVGANCHPRDAIFQSRDSIQ